MLSVELLLESSRREAPRWPWRHLVDDACLQAAYCLDAPHEVQDGVQWVEDPHVTGLRGPVPRMVELREPACPH
jgi:hypothetical protein